MRDQGFGAVLISGTTEQRARTMEALQRAQRQHGPQLDAGQLARLRSIEGGAEVGVAGWPGLGYDVHGRGLGGISVEGSGAGMLDVVGLATAVSQLPAGSKARFADMLRAVDPASISTDAVQAAAVLSRPLGLPAQSMMTVDSPSVARKQYIGLGSRVALLAGAGVDIIAQPQSVARIERLIIESVGTPTASGRDFVVSRLDIGDARQMSGQGEIPGLAFSSEGFQLDVRLDTSNPGNTVTISAENITAGTITLALVGIGTVVR